MKKAHICPVDKCVLFSGGEGEIFLAACAALHCCGARKNHRAYAILDFFDRSHSSRSLHPPPAAVDSLPLAGARVQIFSDPPTKKGHRLVSFSLAEKERFELSRRYSRPTPLAGAPLRPLEYFSVCTHRSRRLHRLATSYIIHNSSPFVKPFFEKFWNISFSLVFRSLSPR